MANHRQGRGFQRGLWSACLVGALGTIASHQPGHRLIITSIRITRAQTARRIPPAASPIPELLIASTPALAAVGSGASPANPNRIIFAPGVYNTAAAPAFH